jgi:hypothetical protein
MASVGRGCIAGPLRCTGLETEQCGPCATQRARALGAVRWPRLERRVGGSGGEPRSVWHPPLVRPDPQLVQAGPQLVQAGPQLVQAGPQLVQAGPQLVQAGPQLVQVPPSVRGQFSLVGGGPSLACAMFKIL